MNNSELQTRLQKNRPMTMISLRIPEDVLSDLKKVAPQLGFSGYQPLIRAYVGQGLRADLARLAENPDVSHFIESLRNHGVDDSVIASALADAQKIRAAA